MTFMSPWSPFCASPHCQLIQISFWLPSPPTSHSAGHQHITLPCWIWFFPGTHLSRLLLFIGQGLTCWGLSPCRAGPNLLCRSNSRFFPAGVISTQIPLVEESSEVIPQGHMMVYGKRELFPHRNSPCLFSRSMPERSSTPVGIPL